MAIDLANLRNRFFDKSEQLWQFSLGLNLVAQALTLVAVSVKQELFSVISGAIVLIAPVAVMWLREVATTAFNLGDKCRRLILYSDALGQDIPKDELATLRSKALGETLTAAPFIKPYYASTLQHGPQRLADITAEAAFFTAQLASRVSSLLLKVIVVSVLLFILILYIFSSVKDWNSQANLAVVSSSVAMAVALFLGSDVILLRKKYQELSSAADNAFKSCASLREKPNVTLLEVSLVVEDYHNALVQSPPIPVKVYLAHRDELNKIYRESHSLGEG